MATYHLTTKVFSRSQGHSAVAGAAYRSASSLHDERLECVHDFSKKPGVVYREIMLPADAPEHLADREILWNEVEAAERRRDAQLSREIEVSLPVELSQEGRIELARRFADEAAVALGMIADVCVHEEEPGNPHAHINLTMREVGPDGFGKKVRAWNDKRVLLRWREQWAVFANQALAAEGRPERIDHRSYRERGIDLLPGDKVGRASIEREAKGQPADRVKQRHRIAGLNGDKLENDPRIALDVLTEHQSTFTRKDMARLVNRCTDGAEQFARVMAKLEAHPDLVRLGKDSRDEERFSTRTMVAIERAMADDAMELFCRNRHGVADEIADRVLAAAELGPEQQQAYRHVLKDDGLSLLVGYAGTGKSRMLKAAREAWEAQGYRVLGASLAGIAAEGLEASSGIASRTIASHEWRWAHDKDKLTANDVLVIDEAGMVGSRQLGRLAKMAREAGAKLVLVGDPEQLQAIEAGAPMRSLMKRHGFGTITQVRRQRTGWMREATTLLATGKVGAALKLYDDAGMLHRYGTRDEARQALIDKWDFDRLNLPSLTQMLLAFTNAEVDLLNEMARDRMRASGHLQGEDHEVATTRGPMKIAIGDRIRFLSNDTRLGGVGVKNGRNATVRAFDNGRLTVQLDDGRKQGAGQLLSFDVAEYNALGRAYAGTGHKMQGQQARRTYVQITPHMRRDSAYPNLTRHTERVDGAWAEEDFKSKRDLAWHLSRDGTNRETTLDYEAAIRREAERLRKEKGMAMKRDAVAAKAQGPTPRMDRYKAAIQREAERLRSRIRGKSQDAGMGL